MFKNREFRLRIVKTQEDPTPMPTLNEVLNPDWNALIEERSKQMLRNLAITVVATVAAIKVIDTVGDIIVKNS